MEQYDELKHYGVLGMKWGRRKGSSTTSAKAKKSARTEEQNQQRKKTLKKVDRIQSKLDSQKPKKMGPVGSTLVKGTASLHNGLAKIDRSAANASKRDAESIRSQKKQMLALTKNGKPLFTEKDIDNMIKAYDSQSNKSESKAKKTREICQTTSF